MEQLVCVSSLLGHVLIGSTYPEMAIKAEFTGIGQMYVSELQSSEKAQPCK